MWDIIIIIICVFVYFFLRARAKKQMYRGVEIDAHDEIQGEKVSLQDLIKLTPQEESSLPAETAFDPALAHDSELSYMEAKALIFWVGKKTDYKIPKSNYSESAVGNIIEPIRFLERGYLEKSPAADSIELKTVPELKAILADRELKISGNKSELINRIISNIDTDDLEDLFPLRKYRLTEKGEKAIEPYDLVFESENHALGFSFYRLMKEKERTPFDSNNAILTRLLFQDVQDAYKRNDKNLFIYACDKTARYMMETEDFEKAFDYYVLSFFVWSRGMPNASINAYMSMNIDMCGKMCGYSFEEMLVRMESVLQEHNPFSLTTHFSINDTVSLFKRSIAVADYDS